MRTQNQTLREIYFSVNATFKIPLTSYMNQKLRRNTILSCSHYKQNQNDGNLTTNLTHDSTPSYMQLQLYGTRTHPHVKLKSRHHSMIKEVENDKKHFKINSLAPKNHYMPFKNPPCQIQTNPPATLKPPRKALYSYGINL
jgi:hypothetical protein